MSEHAGKMIYIQRFGKQVKATLMKPGDGKHYRAAYIGPDGKPKVTMVPFAEANEAVKNNKIAKR